MSPTVKETLNVAAPAAELAWTVAECVPWVSPVVSTSTVIVAGVVPFVGLTLSHEVVSESENEVDAPPFVDRTVWVELVWPGSRLNDPDGGSNARARVENVPLAMSVVESERSMAAVTTWGPGESGDTSNGLAFPLVAVPAKSHGPFFSIRRGGPVICGSSRKKRTLLIPVAGGTKM